MSDAASVSMHRENLLDTITKAVGGGDQGIVSSNILAREEEFAAAMGALPCPYPPEPLVRLYERSSALRPCVEAMVTNVHAFGHRIVPRVDLAAPDVSKRIADILLAERVWNGDDNPADPGEQEIEAKRVEIERGTRIEAIRLAAFFENCANEGWTELRLKLATDLEITGNAYMEVVRNAAGRVARLTYCPSVNMRMRPLEKDPVRVTKRVWVSDISFELEEEEVYPRGFLQRVNARTMYFKAFGDPRRIHARDGRVLGENEVLGPEDREATEIVHFTAHSSRTSYGVPRWIGAVFEVLGIEAYSQVNYLTFDNKGIPPLAVTVSGGSLTDDSVQYLQNYWQAKIKGRLNFHSLLILEAVPTAGEGGSSVQTRIGIQPLAQPQDAVFLQYAARSEDIVGRQWRLSPITRGKVESTFNKATAEAALKKDEEQVFQPERRRFDVQFERTVLRDLGVRYHRVESNSPVASDPESLAKILEILVKNNILTLNEGRRVANAILNEDFQEIQADWAKQPAAFTLNGIPLQEDADDPVRSKMADAATTIQRVLDLRAKVHQETMAQAAMAEAKARADEAGVVDEHEEIIDGRPVTVVRMLPEAFAKIVRPHGAANDAAEDQDDDAAA